MRVLPERVIYLVTAPVRLFGRSRALRLTLGGGIVVAVFFSATLWALERFFPNDSDATKAVSSLPPLPGLQPVGRASYVIAPVTVALSAIRASMEAATPRDLAGKSDNPVSSLLHKADIGLAMTRGAMAVSGKPNELTIITPLTGDLKIAGQFATRAGDVTGTIAGLLDGVFAKDVGKDVAKNIGHRTSKVLDQRGELRGQVIVNSKPALTANWRLEPNLSGHVALGDSTVTLGGFKINVASEAKPLVDRAVNEQIAGLQARLRSDPFIERTAREQWAKMCRSIPLGGGDTGLPKLWLEMRPVRAAAAQPQVDARNVTLTVGVQAETRIVPTATEPNCPFPAQLELVPPMENGRLAIGLPIDMPFTELNKLLVAQLKGKRFPADNSGPVDIEVRGASLAAAGEKLLISLRLKARERKSWFGFGAEAAVHIWGKPVLDRDSQILRLADLTMAVESEAAFGLLGAAARAGMPYLQRSIADSAVIDLKPFAADALAKIGVALADFTKDSGGVRIDAAVHDLRMTGIEFDSHTLRVIAEANGSAQVAVSQLPKM